MSGEARGAGPGSVAPPTIAVVRVRYVVIVLAIALLGIFYVGTTGTEPTDRPMPTIAVSPKIGTGPDSPGFDAPAPAPIVWSRCGSFDCATVAVPLDYQHPQGEQIALALKRRRAAAADRRIGSLLINPGGPGIPGTLYVDTSLFSAELRDRFDIVGWDPRGVGQSSPVRCVDDQDPYASLDPTPDTPQEQQALIDGAKAFIAACVANSGKLLPFVSTADSARDMEQIRRALGEDSISYFGFSYGSELGATYATLFPKSVRAMVIDGATDPNATFEERDRQQVVAIERSLDKLLGQCSADAACPFNSGGDAKGAFDRLWSDLDTNPLPVAKAPGRPLVGQGVATWAIVETLYDSATWPALTKALVAARAGDGSKLLALYDSYFRRGDARFAHSIDALLAIDCLDDPGPTDIAAVDALAAKEKQAAPRMGGGRSYVCSQWPYRSTKTVITGKGAGPIVVVGTTGDPFTPIESSTNMAEELEGGVLLTVNADHHTGYSAKDPCAVTAVDRYLVDLVLPAAGTVCG